MARMEYPLGLQCIYHYKFLLAYHNRSPILASEEHSLTSGAFLLCSGSVFSSARDSFL